MTGWWRRNAVALIALPVLAAGFWGVSAIDTEINGPVGVPDPIVVTDNDSTVEFAGFDLTRFRGASISADKFPQYDVPKDTHYVAIAFSGRVIDADKTKSCTPITITEATGHKRTFSTLPYEFGWDDEDFATDCYAGLDPTFRAFVPFLVPDDSHGPYVVTLRNLGGADLTFTVEAAALEDSED